MEQSDKKITLEEAKKIILNRLIHKETYDNITLLSFLSLLFKQQNQDNIVQDFEIEVLRQNDYCVKSFTDLKKVINKINIERKIQSPNCEEKWIIFVKIAEILENLQQQMEQITKQQNVKNTINNQNEIDNLLNQAIIQLEEEIKKQIQIINTKKTKESNQQLFGELDVKTYSLSPTKGISMLNENPYKFYVEKVLNINIIDDWNSKIDARTYGTIIHEILQNFSQICKDKEIDKITEDLFFEVAYNTLNNYSLQLNSFFKSKIEMVSKIAVKLEKNAKQKNRRVLVETTFSHNFNGVKINAKADRIEIDDKNKLIYIFDYKTGTSPTENDELKGKKTQLAIIALLMLQENNYKDYTIAENGLYYISFSGKEDTKTFTKIDKNIVFNSKNNFKSVEENINELLQQYFQNGIAKSENMKIYIKSNNFYQKDEDDAIKHFSRKSCFLSNNI